MQTKSKIIIGALLIVTGAATTYYSNSVKKETKLFETSNTEINEVITKPSGEIIKRQIRKITTKRKEKRKIASPKSRNWILGISSSVPYNDTPKYTLKVDRRILGNMYLGGYIRTDKELGLSISLSF